MAVLPPELHVLSSWMSEKIGGKGFEIWNINTPPKRSLVCSILMSSLYSTRSLSIEKKFLRFIETLRLESKRNQVAFPRNKINVLKRLISKFNPFKNRYAFYCDKNFLILLKHFETILNNLIAEEMYGASSHDEQVLQAASDCLNCFIDVYETDAEKQHHFFFYRPINALGDGKSTLKRLIIFKKTSDSETSSFVSYGFGLSLKYALVMRIDAFSYFANAANFPPDVLNRFKATISNDSNFLIGALSTCRDIIPYLYKLPYVARKLPDGGIYIDPKATDKHGLSAFYYCISTFDIPLLRVLYNHASNNFDVTDNNVRNPNKSILIALQEIGDTLKKDLEVLKELFLLGDERQITENFFHQFICFNSYQCTVVERILLIREQIADRDIQQQQIIISIIEEYCKCFLFGEGTEQDYFKNYMTFSEYYDILDLFTSFLLFDNLVLLNHIVNEQNVKRYADVIRSLFLFILSHKLFHRKETWRNQSIHPFEEFSDKDDHLRFIPFCYRNCFKKDLMTLYEELKFSLKRPLSPTYSSGSKSKKIDILRESIAGLTEIENEYFARKLKNYMNITKILPQVNIFSLERILQIMGELLSCSDINNTIFKFFLCSCLPEGLEKILSDLRHHCLSHYRNNTVQGRLNIEYNRNESLKCLHNEIRDLSLILEPITGNHFYRVREFMIEKGKKESKQKFRNVFRFIQHEHKTMIRHRKMNFKQNQKDYAVVSKNLFHSIYNVLKQNNTDNMELQVRLNALIFLSNYICTSLKEGDEHAIELKSCSEQLKSTIDSSINSKLPLMEVKKAINHLELVYRDIFFHFDELTRFEGRVFSRAIYFIEVYRLLLTVFSNHAYKAEISEQQMETELEREMSDIVPSIFKMDEMEVEKLVKFSESLIFMAEDNTSKRNKKVSLIRIFKKVLEKNFKRKTNMSESDLKFPLLNGIVSEMKDFDIFSIKEKTQIEKKMAIYLNNSKLRIEKLAMVLEIRKPSMELKRKENAMESYSEEQSMEPAEESNFEKQTTELENKEREMSQKQSTELEKKAWAMISDNKKQSTELVIKECTMIPDSEKQTVEMKNKKMTLDLESEQKSNFRSESKPEEVTQFLQSTAMSQKMIKKCISKLFPKPNIKSAIALLNSESEHKVSIDLTNNATLALKKMLIDTSKDRERYRRMFLNIQWNKNLQLKIYSIMNQKLYFLINRIEELQKILIDDDEKVKYLWLNGKSAAIKQHTKVLMCQRFMKERETRSALEMLFFDCLNALEDTDLREMWEKATNLFAGIDLRDFISHGSPVVELVSSYLDPKDLPLELINKILMLIEDKTAMTALSELWISAKATRSGELAAIIERNDDDEYIALRKDITNCARWRKYFNLLPLEYGD